MNKLDTAVVESRNDKFAISMPFAKVNKEKRTVSGWASLDNLDRHGDIVTKEANRKAFDGFRRNIREMHGPTAVGKMLDFKEDVFFDPETEKSYNGVYVTAYISKGAQDAWEKCLDGTYTGFSIGGNINDAKVEKAQDGSNKSYRVIHDYDLHELSLVDSPANQLANFMSIEKNTDGTSFIKGMVSDTVTENVFWCKSDEVASTSSEEAKDCVVCGDQMVSIGWVEQAEVEKFESIQKVIDDYLTKDDAPNATHDAINSGNVIDSQETINLYPDQNKVLPEKVKKGELENSLIKGGNEMTEETITEVVSTTDVETPSEVEAVDETAEVAVEEVEKAISLSEVEDTLDFTKAISDLKSYFGESLEKNYSESVKSVTDISKMFEETANSLQKAVTDLSDKYEALNKTVTDMYGEIGYVKHQVESFESASAVKKSSDLSGSMESTKIQKSESIWQGHFLGVKSLT